MEGGSDLGEGDGALTGSAARGGGGVRAPQSPPAPAVAADDDVELLAVIGDMGLERLRMEPRRLAAAQEALGDRVQQFALEHYAVHVETHHVARETARDAAKVSASVDGVRRGLPKLQAALDSAAKRATGLREEHVRLRRTLQYHTQLLELLEVPQLTETCVRNGLYDSALELVEFASALVRRHRLAEWLQRREEHGDAGGGNRIIYSVVRRPARATTAC